MTGLGLSRRQCKRLSHSRKMNKKVRLTGKCWLKMNNNIVTMNLVYCCSVSLYTGITIIFFFIKIKAEPVSIGSSKMVEY
jgi:hypothetical protein